MANIRDELETVREQNGGVLTPHAVLEAARSEDHPLHSRFEWNDEVAGEKYRLSQARELIRTVRIQYITPGGEPQQVRAYHSLPGPSGHAYHPAEEIVENELQLKLLLRQMDRDWRQLRVRYGRFDQFAAMVLRDLAASSGEDAAAAAS